MNLAHRFTLLLALASSSTAFADPPPATPRAPAAAPATPATAPPTATPRAPAPAASEDTVVYASRTVIDFSALAITGEVTRPNEAYLMVPRRAKFRTLIRTRGGFLPEIERSVSNL